jgi:hypothetical protein
MRNIQILEHAVSTSNKAFKHMLATVSFHDMKCNKWPHS